MPTPRPWRGEAFNPVPDSDNRIHGDEVARAYGFRGGLVPGVVVTAYLAHPAAVAWGRAWLERGAAHAVVRSPVYDGETFAVELEAVEAAAYRARLVDVRGDPCATADVSLPVAPPDPPVRRGDPEVEGQAPRRRASRESLESLRDEGLRALRVVWGERAEITQYLRDPRALAPVFRATGLASPAFVLALSNWLLAANLELDAWLHLETRSQNFRAVEPGDALVVEGKVEGLFEKKGHHFVDLDVGVFSALDDAAMARIGLRAIYQLRNPE